MHNFFLKKYYFIDNFDKGHLLKLDKKIVLIYRNYKKLDNLSLILKLRKFSIKNGRKLYLANNIKLAIKLGLNGVYLPSFNKDMRVNIYCVNKKFQVIGSAHNTSEINIKIQQGVKEIFLSPIFKKKKSYLGIYGFLKLRLDCKIKLIALGGVTSDKIKYLENVNAYGFAAINYFKKKAPKRGL